MIERRIDGFIKYYLKVRMTEWHYKLGKYTAG